MDQRISEFSYGFALTNELIGWTVLKAAPIFPSLIEEGRKGGGYDVKLDMPGVVLYLQFKRAHCMLRRSARELKEYGAELRIPFYRFHITDGNHSQQHASLLELDDGTNQVFYVAPRFYLHTELTEAWNNRAVASSSIFVRPQSIGTLEPGAHHVAYDDLHAYICSNPRPIHFVTADALVDQLSTKLSQDDTPLRAKLAPLKEGMRQAVERVSQGSDVYKIVDTMPRVLQRALPSFVRPLSFDVPPIPSRGALTPEDPGAQQLRDLAQMALQKFEAQLIVIQKN